MAACTYRLERARKQFERTPCMDALECGEGMLQEKLKDLKPEELVEKLNDVSGMNLLKDRYIRYYSIYNIMHADKA